jgi:transcriptional regulator with XRE-family HTH domain
MIETPFGNLLDTHRKQKKLTPRDLALKADVSPSYISLLISGKKGRPSDQIIEKLAQALELTEDEKLEFQAAAEASKANGSKDSVRQLPYELPDKAGIVAVHPALSRGLLEEYFLKANKLIRIQDSWLEDLFTYNNVFRELLKKVSPELEIEILLLNPTCPVASIREDALNMPENYVRDQIYRTIGFFESIYKDFRAKRIELRLFDVLPSVQQIAVDDTIFIGFYSHTARSQSTYQLQIKADSKLGNFFKKDFEKVWGIATPNNLESP